MKIHAPFTIEWEYGPNKPCAALKPYHRFRWAAFGFLRDAQGHVIKSYLYFRGKVQ